MIPIPASLLPRYRYALLVLAVTAVAGPVVGQTTFNGGNVFTAASWSNGLPSVGNNGTIATDGTFSAVFNFNQNTAGTVTVNLTGGTLSSTGANFYNGPTDSSPGWATFNWNQIGGTIAFGNSGGSLSPNLRTTYTLAGGSSSRAGR